MSRTFATALVPSVDVVSVELVAEDEETNVGHREEVDVLKETIFDEQVVEESVVDPLRTY